MNRRAWLGGSIGALCLATVPRAAQALCAAPHPVLVLRGAVGATRPRGAGLVVVRETTASRTFVRDLDVVRWVGPGQTPFALDVEEVCEDVYALRPAQELAVGRYTLRGVGREPITVELVDTALVPPAAPRVRSLRRTRGGPVTSTGLGVRTAGEDDAQLTLELAAPPAGAASWAGALALASWTEGGRDVSTWGAITSTSPHPTARLAWNGHCAGHGRFPPSGAQVHVRVLDLSAQLSPPSAAVAMAG